MYLLFLNNIYIKIVEDKNKHFFKHTFKVKISYKIYAFFFSHVTQ